MIISILLLIIFFSGYYYFFNIFETIISVNPQNLYADAHSTVTIEVIPINALGWKVPLRHVSTDFKFKEGQRLIDIIYENKKDGVLKLRAKNLTGTVVIYVKSIYSLLPTLVEIHIYPNLAMNNIFDNQLLN